MNQRGLSYVPCSPRLDSCWAESEDKRTVARGALDTWVVVVGAVGSLSTSDACCPSTSILPPHPHPPTPRQQWSSHLPWIEPIPETLRDGQSQWRSEAGQTLSAFDPQGPFLSLSFIICGSDGKASAAMRVTQV